MAHKWFYDGTRHVDPQKEANAQSIRLKNRTTTYAQEFGAEGKDWEAEFEQMAREDAKMAELKIVAENITIIEQEENTNAK